ncbi:MAG: RNA polymerase sigma factor [Lachnospiraceae bacterium]|nr:RNA polymerase sigma factor [Lachnospiraceae bacterium]
MTDLYLLLETPEDKASFQKLYENIYIKLLYVAQGILHNKQDAEDVVHDVFAKVAKNYHKYRNMNERDMLSLCIVITRNACINVIRQNERRRETVMEIKDDLLPSGEDLLEGILQKEKIAILEQALLKLSTEDKNILILRYYHGMSYKEIGRTLGIKTKTVDMRLYRVKAKLREVLLREQ